MTQPWPTGWRHVFESSHAVQKPYVFNETSNEYRCSGDRSAQRFEVQANDVGKADQNRKDGIPRERSEMCQEKPWQVEGEECWYAWSMLIPPDFPEAPPSRGRRVWPQVVLTQFQQDKGNLDDWHPSFMFAKVNTGPFLVRRFQTVEKENALSWALIEDREFKGVWHDFLVHARWSTSSGFFHVWVDGLQKMTFDGPTRLKGAGPVYHKYGVYRVADDHNPPAVAYFSGLRRGSTRKDVE